MQSENISTINSFAQDVQEGFSKKPKILSSKYFYDDEGSTLFAKIMDLPEYYVTNAEYDIFENQGEAIIKAISQEAKGVHLIELGAGNGLKTSLLLEKASALEIKTIYTPIDISEEAIQQLESRVSGNFPKITIKPIVADYFDALEQLSASNNTDYRKVVLFLGSNIGNFSQEQSVELLQQITDRLSLGDMLLIGFDLKKNPRTILAAYDDPSKVTKAFNINLLSRINRELGADFNIDNFDHYAVYDPEAGEARSYLVSLKDQEVFVEEVGETFYFKQWEYIHTEISRKYDSETINSLAKASGCALLTEFKDSRNYFSNAIWQKR